MEKELIVMITQIGVLVVAIVTLGFQQRQSLKNSQKVDKRVETKLKLFYIIQEKEMRLDEIVSKYKEVISLDKSIDEVEIRKSLYEMLKDETVFFTRAMTYRPKLGRPLDSNTLDG